MKEPLLFISAENPYPQDSGGKLRTGNILKLLQGKYEVELITYANPRKTGTPEGLPSLTVHEVERTVSYRRALLRSCIPGGIVLI